MGIRTKISNSTGALFLALITSIFAISAPDHSFAQTTELDGLFEQLQDPALQDWKSVENKIWKEWSRSGSDSLDLLLERGKRAMERGNLVDAIDHLTALTDQAPEFAEGWNARATAFFMMQRYGLSVADIERTLALNPRHFGAMSGLGMIMENLGKPKEALLAYKGARAVHPFLPDVLKAIERLEEAVSGTAL
jgi:tetratricopeptide (TPR) repeat protein